MCVSISSSSANFSLEGWYKHEADTNMSKVIANTENDLRHSISDYDNFTMDILQEGSIEINQHVNTILSSSNININHYSTAYIEEITSTINELESNRYDQLVNNQITENNQEIEAEFNQMLEEILSE